MRGTAAVLTALALVGCGEAAPPPGHQAARTDWARWSTDVDAGEVSAVDVDSHGHVFVLHRPGRDWVEPFPASPIAAPVVAMFDASGTLLAQWGAGETAMPHGLSVAPDDTLWITDVQREQLLHFSHDGRPIGVRGERGKTGADLAHFGRPTDVAATPNRLFVADGYRNARILRLEQGSASEWGEAGDGPAGFALPHSADTWRGLILVSDRENGRLKIHTEDGQLERIVTVPGRPYAAKFLPDGRILSLEGRDAGDREGAVLRLWSPTGEPLRALDVAPDANTRGHDLAVARDGTIYIADVKGRRVLTVPLAQLTGH